jgi:hypothetical protein
MSLKLPPKEKSFELTPADTHLAVCYRLIDLGTQQSEWNGKVLRQHKIMLSWELPNALMTEGENTGKPFTFHQRYTYSSSDMSNLRQDLEAWRGIPFTDADFQKFDLGVLLSKGCLIGIVHESKNGKTYANKSSIMKLPKGMTVPPLVNEPINFDLSEFDQGVYDKLSEGLQAIIAKSPEYQQLKGATEEEEISRDEEVTGHLAATPNYNIDEIPF